MTNWGTVPDWITAVATAGSLVLLFDYARSARSQVEAGIRPVVIIGRSDDGRFYFRNIGPGPALNVDWTYMPSSGNAYPKHRTAVETGSDYDFGDPFHFVFVDDALRVGYESSSGQRYESTAKLVKNDRNGFDLELKLNRKSGFRLQGKRNRVRGQQKSV